MTCSEARARLLRLIAPPRPAGPLADHLDSCASCGAFAARLALAVRSLADHHARVEPDAAFAARVVAALPERRPLVARFALRLLPAALALALVLGGWVVLEQRRHPATQETAPTDDLLGWVLQDEENGI